MPLSEDEQRILHEIERSFYENDPAFAKGVSQTTLYRHAGRNLKFSALGFVTGLVVLLVSFASSLVLGMAGFLAMLGSAFVFERNLRKMGRAGWEQWTKSVRDRNIGDMLGNTRSRLRDRFRRDDD
ncbi:MAG TPA: DUF3040 domain-containing protein [Acidimicrobiales bacterium]|nr:DUF3040 domain-containing protein [Acidimicrobiales bacterium]